MGFVNLTEKTISAKLVYYGVGLGGKTTSLKMVHGQLCPRDEVKLVSINTEQDATLLFDFLPIDLGSVEGFKIRVQGFTVPGQDKYVMMRRYVLSGADAVVLVIDTQRSRIDENLQSIEDLKKNLEANGLNWETIPLVIQYNKRDLDDVLSREELDELFLFRDVPAFETVATEGRGVMDGFIESCGQMVEEKVRAYGLGKGTVEPEQVAEEAQNLIRQLPSLTAVQIHEEEETGEDLETASPKLREGLLELTVPDEPAPNLEVLEDEEDSLESFLDEEDEAELDGHLEEIADSELRFSGDEDLAETSSITKSSTPQTAPEQHKADSESPEEAPRDEAPEPEVSEELATVSEVASETTELLGQAISSNMEMAELYAELAEYKGLLEKKNRELVEVIQVITHDLKRPLTVFKTVTGLLLGGHLGELQDKQTDAVRNASESVHYMEELLLDILDASRLDYDGVQLSFEESDMTLLVGGIIRRLRFQLEERDIRIRVEPLPSLCCDPNALTKVFMNLIGNAISYMDPEKEVGRIEVRASDTGDAWEFVVEDNGLGIPDDCLANIWKKFERGTNAVQVSGTGLGLYIVRQLVLGHGGDIDVESTLGGGSRFRFSIPKEPVLAEHRPAL